MKSTVTFEFNLPEEQPEFELLTKRPQYLAALSEIKSIFKWKEDADSAGTITHEEAYAIVLEVLCTYDIDEL